MDSYSLNFTVSMGLLGMSDSQGSARLVIIMGMGMGMGMERGNLVMGYRHACLSHGLGGNLLVEM